MKKLLVIGMYVILGLQIIGATNVFASKPNDRLKDSFKQSHTISSEPYSSDIEADQMFQEGVQLSTSSGLGLNDNVFVRMARFLMRIALIIGISMLIYVGIKLALARGDSGKMETALKEGGKVLLGAFLVLASVAIVFLVSSLMRGSLDYSLFNG